MRARLLITAVTVAMTLGGGLGPARVAHAADDVTEAKRYYEAGVQAYAAAEYVAAITAFEEAYRLSPRASVVFSLGQAYRRQYFVDHDPAKLKRAVELYREYIGQVDKGERRDEAVRYLGDLEPLLLRIEDEQRSLGKGPVKAVEANVKTQLMVTSKTPGARAALDGDHDGALETPAVFETKPGQHQIRVEAPGFFPEDHEGNAVEGRLVVVDAPLKEKPARLTIRAARGASVTVDGRPRGTLPLATPIELGSGRHFVAVSRRGHYPYTEELVARRDQDLTLSAPLHRTTQRWVSYYFFGGAAALAVAGGVTTFVALGAASDADAIEAKIDAGTGITLDELREHNDAIDTYDTYRTASYVLFGASLATAATGALLYLIDHPDIESPRERSGIAPLAGGGSVGMSWSTRF